MSSKVGALVPFIFGLSASMPVVIIAWIMKKAVNRAEKISSSFEHFQKWLNACAGILFIAIAILLMMHE